MRTTLALQLHAKNITCISWSTLGESLNYGAVHDGVKIS